MRVEVIASGPGFQVHDVQCSAGPGDRPFEERHPGVCIAAVLQGSFQYRTTQGTALLAPGAVLLGNAGHGFECGHDHGVGDHCLSFLFDPACLADVLAAVPGGRTNFRAASLPPLMALAPVLAAANLARIDHDPAALEESAVELAGQVALLLTDQDRPRRAPSHRDEQRITATLHRIEQESDQALGLDQLALDACMSRYHFLRTFRQVVGVTPHQYILRTRLQNAAIELRRTRRPILQIALDAGFADLSTFNRRFRTTMGMTPGDYRRHE